MGDTTFSILQVVWAAVFNPDTFIPLKNSSDAKEVIKIEECQKLSTEIYEKGVWKIMDNIKIIEYMNILLKNDIPLEKVRNLIRWDYVSKSLKA